MDEIAQYNRERWQALAAANALFTRPALDLNATTAREMVDPNQVLGNLEGKSVLCLAGGGGKQSAAFGLLGAEVTVVDISEEQLEHDRAMAQHYDLTMTLHQGDMRDLGFLARQTFDIVFQPYSLNFVPDATEVFAQVAWVIKPQGIYDFMCANPFVAGLTERDWDGSGYRLTRPYVQGEQISYADQEWVYDRDQHKPVPPPVEYRQTLSTLINGLVANSFVVTHAQEISATCASATAEPGTWDHFTAIVPPWLRITTEYCPKPATRE